MVGCDVAANGTACGWVAGARRGQWHREDLAGDFGDHEPMGRWFGGIEQGITGPYVVDVIDPQVGVFEEVTGLPVDFKRPVIIELFYIEPVHMVIVLQALTNDYK